MNSIPIRPKSGIVKLTLFLAVIGMLAACSPVARITAPPAYTMHESGIEYRILNEGKGRQASLNDMVYVHYTLMLEDSTMIDSSFERGEPVSFKIGSGQVIKGWDIAMTLLSEGDQAILRIPPELGYGDQAMGAIPANSLLVFNVTIKNVIPAPEPFAVTESMPVEQSTSGLRWTIVKEGKGKKLESGMKVKVHYTGFFDDMTLFDSSLERNQPIEITLGRGMVIRGWEEGLSYLRVGDKARLWIPYQLAYGEQGRGPIPARADLIFDVEVIEASDIIRAEPYNVAGKDTLSTDSGLRYIIVQEGAGNYPTTGDIVRVHYSGFLSDGTLFDSSVERDQPFRFVLGQGQVIRGWDEGVAQMRQGAKYRFIIPPDMAYGDRATGPIPAGSTLVFDVELLEIE